MNRHRKGVMPEITRDLYKAVRKYDRQEFEDFCRSLYTYGFEDGRDSVPQVDVVKILDAIAGTKGIGPKKLDEIMANIDAILTGEPAAQRTASQETRRNATAQPTDAQKRGNTHPEAKSDGRGKRTANRGMQGKEGATA